MDNDEIEMVIEDTRINMSNGHMADIVTFPKYPGVWRTMLYIDACWIATSTPLKDRGAARRVMMAWVRGFEAYSDVRSF